MPAQTKTRQTREPLTRERIVAVALRVMDEEGLEAVTMRRVGRELGVEAMSLYNHVADKDDILNGIAELVMTEFDFPGDSDDWKEDARRASRAWRTLLKAHPNVMVLLSERRSPISSPDALLPTEHAISVLRRAGLSPEETVRAFRAFGGYIQGFVLMELANMFGEETSPGAAAPWSWDLPEDTFPMLCSHADFLVHCDPAADFEFGLELLIRGLEAKGATES
jgi:TetR/AcrR family transcriptional regulator, tetracycline repressor protein